MLKPYNKAQVVFDLVKEIGQSGQNSRTYIARNHQLDAEIVIKEIAKAELNSSADLFAESKILYASAHPNVVQIFYACEDPASVYIAMPLYSKGSIKDLMKAQFMTVREIIRAACQILTALHNIHSKKLIHFDVKPDNVLLSDRLEALLSDFGLAKQMNFVGVAAQDRHYTPMIPPEATKSDHFDLTFDIYQFGLTLYKMCNGEVRFKQQLAKFRTPTGIDRNAFKYDVCHGLFPDRRAFLPHIPPRLRTIIQTCLKVDSAQRYQSALDCSNALALVDGPTLDWRFAESSSSKIWTKNEEGTSYEIDLDPVGKCEMHKTVGAGQRRRVSEGCKASITEKDLKKLLGSY